MANKPHNELRIKLPDQGIELDLHENGTINVIKNNQIEVLKLNQIETEWLMEKLIKWWHKI